MINHIPVMLNETINSLKIVKNGCYVDATFGSGGHSTEILNNLGSNGKLFSLDKDHDAITIDNPLKNDKRFTLRHGCFSNLSTLTKAWGIHGAVNGILLSLVSTIKTLTVSYPFKLVLSGGSAPAILKHLNMDVDYVPDLVLDGLSTPGVEFVSS